jgi:ABC-2 type transport system permease protein
MRRRTLAVARAEWIHNYRDPRSLFVIIALPVVLLMLYGYGINFDLDHIPFAVYDLDGTQAARDVVEQLRSTRYFDLRESVHDRRRADELLDRGQVVFVLVLPPDLGRNLGAGREAPVQVLLDGADTTRANVAVGYVDAALSDYSATLAATYLARQGAAVTGSFGVRPTVLYNPGLKSTPFIVPGLIAIILTLLSALLTSTCLVREREWGSFESLVASPATPTEILVGKMIPYIAIAFADVLLCIVAGRLVFGVAPVGGHGWLLVFSAVYLAASLSIGVLVSVIARTQQMAILLAMLGTLLPTILLSGFAFPIHSLPGPLRAVCYLLPATHFLVIIRSIYLKGAALVLLRPRVLALVAFTLFLVIVAVRRFEKRL